MSKAVSRISRGLRRLNDMHRAGILVVNYVVVLLLALFVDLTLYKLAFIVAILLLLTSLITLVIYRGRTPTVSEQIDMDAKRYRDKLKKDS